MSNWILPILFMCILSIALKRKVPCFHSFVEGGKSAVPLIINLFPYLIGMMVAIRMIRASGFIDQICLWIEPLFTLLHVPVEILPLAFLRPISGTASLAMAIELIRTYGVDSWVGKAVAVIQSSTDTTIYIITLYFGVIGIRHYRYALKVGLLADFFGILFSLLIASWFF